MGYVARDVTPGFFPGGPWIKVKLGQHCGNVAKISTTQPFFRNCSRFLLCNVQFCSVIFYRVLFLPIPTQHVCQFYQFRVDHLRLPRDNSSRLFFIRHRVFGVEKESSGGINSRIFVSPIKPNFDQVKHQNRIQSLASIWWMSDPTPISIASDWR